MTTASAPHHSAAPSAAPPLLVSFTRRPGPLRSVLLHPGGGGLGQYVGLVSYLSRRGPLHGVRACGLAVGETPDRSVAAMAERYLPLLRALPEPPNLLIGWSLGGLLAWDLASRIEPGGPPPAVVMIDSMAAPWSALRRDRAEVQARIMAGLPDTTDPAARERAAATTDAHLDACADYRVASRHPGRALLMACSGPARAEQVAAWKALAPEMTVRELDCGHFEMFGVGHLSTVLGHLDAFTAGPDPSG